MRYVSHSTRVGPPPARARDRKSTRLNSSHGQISYAVFCLKKKSVRRERDDRAARAALRCLSDEARGTANLMPAIVEAVKAYATLGEINRAMKDVFGEHKDPIQW